MKDQSQLPEYFLIYTGPLTEGEREIVAGRPVENVIDWRGKPLYSGLTYPNHRGTHVVQEPLTNTPRVRRGVDPIDETTAKLVAKIRRGESGEMVLDEVGPCITEVGEPESDRLVSSDSSGAIFRPGFVWDS